MHEATVYCGGLEPDRGTRGNVYVLDASLPKGAPDSVTIDVERVRTAMLDDLPARTMDLLDIAAYVYYADQLVRRDTPAMQHRGSKWRRSFCFYVSVRDIQFWSTQAVRDQLERTLSILSEDRFKFVFSASSGTHHPSPFLNLNDQESDSGFRPDRIILFSGGLDSLSGALDCLSQGQRVVLLSHRSSDFIVGKQKRLIEAISERYPGKVFPIGVRVTLGGNRSVESTQRTRSFLFSSIGAAVASLFRVHEVSFFENGVVSVNLPIAEHVLGTRATRTTHPAVLHEFGCLLGEIAGRELRPVNPYFWKTKRDIVKRIADLGHGDLIKQTFSCAAVRDAQKDGRHCGCCTQCIDRRFAIVAAECSRHDKVENYRIDPLEGARPAGLGMVTAESFVLTAMRFAEMSRAEFLSNYGQLFRVTPYLDMPMSEAASRLHDLHARHGQAVRQATDTMLARSARISARLNLADSSVLATLMAPAGLHVELAVGPDAQQPASMRPANTEIRIVDRPITFAVDIGQKTVVFRNGATLTGAGFKLFDVLYESFKADGGRPPANHRYSKPRELEEKLGISEQSVRQSVGRIRSSLKRQFSERRSGTLAEDDIIETGEWQGYRLNPHLAHSPGLLSDPRPEKPPMSQLSEPMSQLAPSAPGKPRVSAGRMSQLSKV